MNSRNTKYHPRTLDIPITTTSTSIIRTPNKMIVVNWNANRAGNQRSSSSSISLAMASTISTRNRSVSQSPRRGCVQPKQQQSKQKPSSSFANSISSPPSSSSSSSSGTGTINSTQLESICREVAHIRDEHVAIRNTLSAKDGELGMTRMAVQNLSEERDLLRNKVYELEQILKHSPQMYSHVTGLLPTSNKSHPPIMSTIATPKASIPPHGTINNNSYIKKQPPTSLPPSRSTTIVINPNSNSLQQNQMLTGPHKVIPFPSSTSPVIRNGVMQSNQSVSKNLEGMMEKAVPLSCSPIKNSISHEGHQTNNNSNIVGKMGQQQHPCNNYKSGGNGNNPSHSQNLPNRNKQRDKIEHEIPSAPSPCLLEQERNGNRHSNENETGRGAGHQRHHLLQSGITGINISPLGSDCSTKVVEHLAHPCGVQSSVIEIEHKSAVKGNPLKWEGLREVEIEIDRLKSRIDHLRSQNDVLTLNLEDAKGHSDRLTELLGKYESNNVALQWALRYSDQMTDAYEVLVALLETEMGQVLANLHARGQLNAICPPPGPNNNNTSAGSPPLTTSTTVSRPSGNNNNSNDNSPSDQVPSVSVTAETNGGISESKSNVDKDGPAKDSADNVNASNHKNRPDNSTQNQILTSAPVGSVPDPNTHSPSPPSSSGVSSGSPSSKSVMLLEQAGRNRLVAERTARFLLSRFTQKTNSISFLSPHHRRQNSQSEGSCSSTSTPGMLSSSSSATSNLSNISGESGHHPDSPCSCFSTGEMKLSPPSCSEVTTVMMMVTTSRNCGDSPTTSTTSSTFTATSSSSPSAPYGNDHPRPVPNHSSVIPSLQSFRGGVHVPTTRIPNNSSVNSIPGSSEQLKSPASSSVEPQIRNLISTLKAERDGVKGTVVELGSESLESLTPSPKPFSPYHYNMNSHSNPTNSSSPAAVEGSKLDLETAVLMQELMAMKEERAELHAQVFLLEKEKDSLELRVRSHESQEDAYMARINYLKAEIMDCEGLYSTPGMTLETCQYPHNRNRNEMIISPQLQQQQQNQKSNGNNRNMETAIINNNNNNQNGNREREAVLKKRIHDLASALERVALGSQLQERGNEELINELNRANGILMQTLEASKKKYQNRIKKMEDQILNVS